jgi:YVTN family beta-propeller protein
MRERSSVWMTLWSRSLRLALPARERATTSLKRVGLWCCLTLVLFGAEASASPFAYVANQLSNTVSVIDTATNAVVASPAVGNAPQSVAVNAAATRAYVTNSGGVGSVSVIDTATNAVVGAAITVGSNPFGVAVNPAGTRVYVANFIGNTVSVIDTGTSSVVATIPVGSRPNFIVVNPAGTRAYVTNNISNSVSVIDTGTNAVVGSPITVGAGPVGIAINLAGTRLYVVNQDAGTVSVIDTATNTVVGAPILVGVTPLGVVVNPAGTRVYVTNSGGGTVTVIDTAANAAVGSPITVGLNPAGIAMHPAGTRVYVANTLSATVSVIDTATNAVVGSSIGVGNRPRGVGIVAPTVVVGAPTLQSAASRKVHGSAGPFELPLSAVATNPTTEPRFGPTHTLVFTFNKAVTAGTAVVTEGTATAGVPTFNGSTMIVPLTGVTDQQYVTVTLSNVVASDGGTGGVGSIRAGFLAGDVNQDRVVTLTDRALVNAQVAQFVSAANYLFDVNVSGTLSVSDVGRTNAELPKSLPAP